MSRSFKEQARGVIGTDYRAADIEAAVERLFRRFVSDRRMSRRDVEGMMRHACGCWKPASIKAGLSMVMRVRLLDAETVDLSFTPIDARGLSSDGRRPLERWHRHETESPTIPRADFWRDRVPNSPIPDGRTGPEPASCGRPGADARR